MNRKYLCWACLVLLVSSLYFFENNTGSRVVLICMLLLAAVPAVRRGLFRPYEEKKKTVSFPQAAVFPSLMEEEEPGNVRAYQLGDPVNRIHWKLSSKRDEILVRIPVKGEETEEAGRKTEKMRSPSAGNRRKTFFFVFVGMFCLTGLLLFLIPSANRGAQALANRLYHASEAVNSYAYEYFPVPEDQNVTASAVLFALLGISMIGMTALSHSRLPSFLLYAGIALFQMYFGLAFPAWGNIGLFLLFVLWQMRRGAERRSLLAVLGVITAVTVAVTLFYPGINAATEEASEKVRDSLSRISSTFSGTVKELPAGENETRHVHSQSLISGESEAGVEEEYSLVTVEEEQISIPHWVNYLKIIALLLLTAVMVVLPFLPFVFLNARRRKILERQASFRTEDIREAIKAIFQQVIRWLEATENGAGNLPYAHWTEEMAVKISPSYAELFGLCAAFFEEAAYSRHQMQEQQREQTLHLLEETERILQERAGWRQKLCLKYKECLWL